MSPPAPYPSLDDEAAGRMADALAPVIGIAIAPEWRPALIANLKATAAAAKLVLDFSLPDDLEPAPVFRA